MAFSAASNGYVVGSTWTGFQWGRWAYFQNGQNDPRKCEWDGSTLTEKVWGQAAPAAAEFANVTVAWTGGNYHTGTVGVTAVDGGSITVMGSGLTWGSYMDGGTLSFYPATSTHSVTCVSLPTLRTQVSIKYSENITTYRIEYGANSYGQGYCSMGIVSGSLNLLTAQYASPGGWEVLNPPEWTSDMDDSATFHFPANSSANYTFTRTSNTSGTVDAAFQGPSGSGYTYLIVPTSGTTYTTGTATCTHGSSNVTGVGTVWGTTLSGGNLSVTHVGGTNSVAISAGTHIGPRLTIGTAVSGESGTGKAYLLYSTASTYGTGTVTWGDGATTIQGANCIWNTSTDGVSIALAHKVIGGDTVTIGTAGSTLTGTGTSYGDCLTSGMPYKITFTPTGGVSLSSTHTYGFALTWLDSTYGTETNPYYPTALTSTSSGAQIVIDAGAASAYTTGVAITGTLDPCLVQGTGVTWGSHMVGGSFKYGSGSTSSIISVPTSTTMKIYPGQFQGTTSSYTVVGKGTFGCPSVIFDTVVEYRNYDGGTYHKVQEIATSSKQFLDNYTTAAISATDALETTHEAPPKAYFCWSWDSRGWLTQLADDSQAISPSLVNEPEYYDSTERMYVLIEDGQPVCGCAMGPQNIIFTTKKLMKIRPSGDTYVMDEIEGGMGIVSPFAFVVIGTPETGQRLVWLAPPGQILEYNGGQVNIIDTKIASLLRGKDKIVSSEFLRQCRAEHDAVNGEIRFRMRSSTGSHNDMAIVYEYAKETKPFWRDTGNERTAFAQTWTKACGNLRYYTDPYGNVWEESDTVSSDVAQNSGTLSGTVTSFSGTTLGDSTGAFTTAGDGQKGTWVHVRTTAGAYVSGRITSGTATALVVSAWSTTGAGVGAHYEIGAIPYMLKTQDIRLGDGQAPVSCFSRVDFETNDEDGNTGTVSVNLYLDQASTAGYASSFLENASYQAIYPRRRARYASFEIIERYHGTEFEVRSLAFDVEPTIRIR